MNLLQMTQAAIRELQASGIADRAIIYVTDDIDRGGGYTPRSVGALAASAHVRVFTVGVPDSIWKHPFPVDLPSPQSMRTLAQSAGGTYIEAAPSQERAAFSQIAAGLAKQYLVTYRSSQPFGKTIVVSIHVDGVPGVVRLTYIAPPTTQALPGRSRAVHHGLFWASSTAVVIAALAAALLVGIAVATLAAHFSRAGRLRARVGEFIGTPPELAQERVGTPETRRSLIDQVLEGRQWWSAFVDQVDISSSNRSPQELVRFAIAASLIATLLLDLFTGSILLAMLGLLAGPIGLRALVKRSVRKQRQKFAEQLPGHLHELASAMRAGRSITDGIAIVAESAEEPMRRELQRVIADERAGLHLDEALLPVGSRMESTEIEQVSVIAALHRRTGANITEVLDRIADTARQRVEIRRELFTMTAQARLSRNVLVLMPVFVAIAINLIGHRYERPLFHTTIGILVMVIAAMMLGLGAKIMKRFVTVEE
jgi:tight adherence protein B